MGASTLHSRGLSGSLPARCLQLRRRPQCERAEHDSTDALALRSAGLVDTARTEMSRSFG